MFCRLERLRRFSFGLAARPPRLAAVMLATVLCVLFAAAPLAKAADAQRGPNVIFILADDLGWSELGCYGNRFNETPNLDKLASGGVRFTQAYAAAPVCSPFRASLMTGQWPARVGITDYLRPNDPKHLPAKHVTLAEMFKQAGYATGMIGKWHLSGYESHGARQLRPTDHGFDEALITEEDGIGGGSYFHPYHFNKQITRRLPNPEHLVDRMNVEAVDFIQRRRDEPFFLYLSHYAVHTRLAGREDLLAKYRRKPGAGDDPKSRRNNVHLAAQLEAIDQGVGMIEGKLNELGLAKNTIVIFTSDNGGEDRVTSNSPLRAGKSTLYEGGLREPLIVDWLGKTPPGAVCDSVVCSVDFYPTLVEAIGAKPDPRQKLDGVSMFKLWLSPAAKLARDTLYWHYPLRRPHFLGGRSRGAIREGDLKLIEDFTTGQLELYDLKRDVSERRNLAEAMPEQAARLLNKLRSWRSEVGAEVMKHDRQKDFEEPQVTAIDGFGVEWAGRNRRHR